MMRLILLLAAAFAACTRTTAEAQDGGQLVESVNAMLAHACTDALPDADRIEVFLLEFDQAEDEIERDSEDAFLIAGSDLWFSILAKRELRGKACDRLVSAWRSTTVSTGGGAFCHVPKYGVRIYNGPRLLLETTVSQECGNFYLPQIDPKTGELAVRMTSFGGDYRRLLKTLGSVFR